MEENQNAQGVDDINLVHLSHFLKQLPTALFGQLFIALVVSVLISNLLSTKEVAIWLSLFVVISAVRLAMYAHQSVNPSTSVNRGTRVFGHVLSVAATAMLWGGLAFLLIDENQQLESLVIVMVLMGIVSGSVGPASNLKYVLPVFSFFSIMPVVVKFFSFGQAPYTFLSFLLVFYLFMVHQFQKRIHQTLTESIQLRFKNLKLIDNLTQEKLRAIDSQRSAEQSLGIAESASVAKSRFLAAASHDLRQPLHALRLLSSTLQSTQLDSQQEPLVKNISSSVKSLEGLLNSLLDISKLDSGTQSVDLSTVYLSDIFHNLQRNFTSVSAERGIQFIVQETNQVVNTDVILLERLLANIVSNSVRYTHEGTIELSTRKTSDRCIIQIRDTGIGISADDQARVFEEFVQLGNPERDRSKGIGLGLSIVKQTADLLELPLTLKSELGEGTTITVSVPLGASDELNEIDLANPSKFADLEGMLILVVDNEISIRIALEGLLDSWGCVSLVAGDGAEALKILHEVNTKPDAIVADLRLRDNETGVDVIQRINKLFDSDCPAIIMTGETGSNSLRELQSTQFPILHKPCDPQVLLTHLADIKHKKCRPDLNTKVVYKDHK